MGKRTYTIELRVTPVAAGLRYGMEQYIEAETRDYARAWAQAVRMRVRSYADVKVVAYSDDFFAGRVDIIGEPTKPFAESEFAQTTG